MDPSKPDPVTPAPDPAEATEIDPRLRAPEPALAKAGQGLLTPSGSIEIPVDFDSGTDILVAEDDLEEAFPLDGAPSGFDDAEPSSLDGPAELAAGQDGAAILSRDRSRAKTARATSLGKMELTSSTRKEARTTRDAATVRIRELERENKELRERAELDRKDLQRREGAHGAAGDSGEVHPDLLKLQRYVADLFNTAQRAVKLDDLATNLRARLENQSIDLASIRTERDALRIAIAQAIELANTRLERIEALELAVADSQLPDAEHEQLLKDLHDAQTARAHAEQAAAEAESARTLAENALHEAGATLAQADAELAEAENARAEAEKTRAEAETARTEAETARAEAETARAEAEAERDRLTEDLSALDRATSELETALATAIDERDESRAHVRDKLVQLEAASTRLARHKAELDEALGLAEKHALTAERFEAAHTDLQARLDELVPALDALTAERDLAIQERDHAQTAYEQVVTERDDAHAERDHAIQERDLTIHERDLAVQERDHAQAEHQHLRAEHDQACLDRDNALAEHAKAKDALETAQQDLDNTELALKATQQDAKAAQQAHKNAQQALKSAQQELKATHHELDQTRGTAAALEVQLQKAQFELEHARGDLDQEHQSALGRIAELEGMLAEANETVARVNFQCVEALETSDHLQQQLDDLNTERENLIKQKDAEREALSNALERVGADRKRLKAYGEELLQKAELIARDAKASKAALDDANARVEQLEGDLALNIDHLGLAKAELAERDEQLHQAETSNDHLANSLDLLQQQLERITSEHAATAAERDELARKHVELAEALDNLHGKETHLDETLATLRTQRDEQANELGRLKEELRQAVTVGESLEAQLAEVERRETEYVASLDALQAEQRRSNSGNRRLEALEAEKQELSLAYEALQKSHFERGAQVVDVINEGERLRVELEAATERLEHAHAELEALRQQIHHSDAPGAAPHHELDQLRTELETVRQRATRLDALIAENDKLRSQIRQIQTNPAAPPPAPSTPLSLRDNGREPFILDPAHVPTDVENEINALIGVDPLSPEDRKRNQFAASGDARTAASNPAAGRDPMQQLRDRGLMSKRPVVDYTRTEGVDHRAGFLLTQVDGMVTVEDLIDLSGLNVRDAAQLVLDLFASGALRS